MNSIDYEDVILRTLQFTFAQAGHVKLIEKSIRGENLNFTSEIVNLTVKYMENDEFRLTYLILKIPAVHSPSFPAFVQLNLYQREICTYEKVLPFINKLLDTNITPLRYSTVDPNILVIENLTVHGYKSAPASEFLNDQQFPPLLKALAKFHAASFLAQQQHPHLLTETIFADTKLSAELQPITDEWIPAVCEILKRTGASNLVPKVRGIFSTMSHENGIKRLIHRENFNFVVFNHGDYRSENSMMKHDDNDQQQAVDVKIIDFQFCSWSSPVLDFLYFMVLSVKTDLIDEHFDNFVNLYVQYLQETLLKLGCTETYDKADFMKDFEKIKPCMNLVLGCLCCILSNFVKRKEDTDGNQADQMPHSTQRMFG